MDNNITPSSAPFKLGMLVNEEEFENKIDQLCSLLLFNAGWKSVLDNSKILYEIPGLTDFPLICKAGGCVYAKVCPVLKQMAPENWDSLVGSKCRADLEYGVRLFSNQVKHFNIQPEDSTDIIQITQLVRLMIMLRRTDWELAINGLMQNYVAGTLQKECRAVYDEEPHKILAERDRIYKQLAVLHNQLNATRKSKSDMENKNKGSSLLDAIRSKSKVIDV